MGGSQRFDAVGVGQRPREQRQPVGRRVGKPGPDPGLLRGDQGRLPVVDRKTAAVLADLGHVVHEHRAGPALPVLVEVLVVVQAVPAQRAQFAGAPPNPGGELDGRPHARARQQLQTLQVVRVEQLGEHHLGQGPADLVVSARVVEAFGAAQHHVGGQRCEHATGLGQAHLPAVAQETADQVQRRHADAAGDGAGSFQVAQAGQEAGHVGVGQGGRVGPGVVAPCQVFGEQSDGDDDRPHDPDLLADQCLARPGLGCSLQPHLGDRPGRPATGAIADAPRR